MIAPDYAPFARAFGRVLGAFRVRLTAPDREELTKTYFKILDPFPIDDVIESGRRCIEKYRKFPLVADWLHELGGRPSAPQPLDVRYMSTAEADELDAATLAHYHGPVCPFDCCAGLGLPVRFVPTLTDHGVEDKAFHPRRQRVEVIGHWAHGSELRQWYAARAACFARARTAPRLVRRVLALVSREPGEEG